MPDNGKIPILLVDDRPENLLALEGLLADLDLDMVLADSGNEALRHSLKRDFSLVLLDVQMPGMDGFETAELMRAHPKTRHIPIIFITAGAKETVHQFKGYEAGAVDFLYKPIETGILRSKVRVFCELYRQRRAIERHERELELLVESRTRELREREAQLRQAQKMEAIGTLAGGIAHDFNNLLAAILGYTELSLDLAPEDGNLRHFLQQVSKAGYRARDLIKQILAFSRQAVQKKQPVCFSLIVKEALKLLRASVPATIEFKENINRDAENANVFADPTALHQILLNLCTNSAHAMREKGGVLEVSLDLVVLDDDFIALHPEMAPGSYLRLSVADSGHGMSEEVKLHIFEPYFTTKKFGEGTGLGLAAVYGLVKDCRGVVTFESEEGRGAIFHVFLPRMEGVAPPREQRPAVPLPRGEGRILVVDDEEMLVETVKISLVKLGYEVVAHTSSLEALLAFKKAPYRFDLMVTDQSMPRMSGAELAREIRAIRPDMPVIICTGFSETMNREKADSIGISRFFLKPVVLDELAVAIGELLGFTHPEREIAVEPQKGGSVDT